MQITVHFYSYFKDLTACAQTSQDLPEGATLGQLMEKLFIAFPKLRPMQRSMLVAVGVEYQNVEFVLHPGDEVSLFPPVQGG